MKNFINISKRSTDKNYFKNSDFQFSCKLDSAIGLALLPIDLLGTTENNNHYYSKGAYKLKKKEDSIYVFKYGIINDSIIQSLNFVTVKDEKVIDNKLLINFEEEYKYDYFIFGDVIQVVKKNEELKLHFTFYESDITTGFLKQLSFTPKEDFVDDTFIDVENKRVVLYNNFQTKTTRLENGEEGKLIGKITRSFGGKEYGFYKLVELEKNDITDYKYLCFKDNDLYLRNQYYFPKDFFGLDSNRFIEKEGTVGYVEVPINKKEEFAENIFIEILE